MFAIVEIQGQQFKVSKGDKLTVRNIEQPEGEKITFDKVYLLKDDKNTEIGTPKLDVIVEAKIMRHFKGEKILVFKMKAKKRYMRTKGHRDHLTDIEITDIRKGQVTVEAKKDTAKLPAKPQVKPEKKKAPVKPVKKAVKKSK